MREEELVLQSGDRALEFCGVELVELPGELGLGADWYGRLSQDALVGRARIIVMLVDFAADSLLRNELHDGLKEVGVEPKMRVKFGE